MYSRSKNSKKGKTDKDFDYLIEALNHESPLCRSVAIVVQTDGGLNWRTGRLSRVELHLKHYYVLLVES